MLGTRTGRLGILKNELWGSIHTGVLASIQFSFFGWFECCFINLDVKCPNICESNPTLQK